MGRLPLLVLGVAIGCATPVEDRRWIEVETPHFRLASGAGRRESVRIARGLSLLRAVLDRTGFAANLEPRVPLRVVVFRDAAEFARFRPRPGVESFTLVRPRGSLLVVHAGKGVDARAAAFHEYVHFVLRNGEATRYPAWYDEGLAEFASNIAIEDDHVVVGTIPGARVHWLAYGSPLGLRSVMTSEDADAWPEVVRDRFYAQSWALVHFFHLSDRAGFPDRRAQMLRYIALLNAGSSPDAACSKAFETDFEGLERDFLAYRGKGELPVLGLSRERLALADEVRTQPLAQAEKQRILGELALALGGNGQAEAERWLRRAVAADPRDGRAHAALARALVPVDGAGADAALDAALALAPEDPAVHELRGDALLTRATSGDASDAAGLVEEARRSFRRSIELDPGQVAAYAGLGRSFLVVPAAENAEGLSALAKAHERLPGDRSISLGRAQLEASAGSAERARRILTRMARPSHGEPVADAERDAIVKARVAVGLPPDFPSARQFLAARLDVDAPREGEHVRRLVGLVEVRGRGGLWESLSHDVIIAIDQSTSTLLPTGSDLDGDGEVGRTLVPKWLGPTSTDPDDSVMLAEFLAARALIRQLDPQTTRVAVLTFAGEASVVAPLGTPEAVLERLDRHRIRADPSGTSLAHALRGALDVFFEGRDGDVRRQRSVILLSDGEPTVPTVADGKRAALELATRLGEIGVPVHAFALGEAAVEAPEFYRALAERSGGDFVPVEDPAKVVSQLANLRFSGLEDVRIRSAPAGAPGRAVRVFANGSFDAYAPLAAGENVITITASLEDGSTLSETRTVFFERPAEAGPGDEEDAVRLRKELQNRALELELLSEIQGRSPGASRQLEMEVER